jgi:tetratricopeptide repeat protein 7
MCLFSYQVEELKSIEKEVWLDLASIYIKLESWQDANLCLQKAKCNQLSSSKYWHVQGNTTLKYNLQIETRIGEKLTRQSHAILGTLFEAQLLEKEALMAFYVSLSVNPDYVPSMVSTVSIMRKLGGESMSVARSFTRSALRVCPTSHDAWLNLGFVCQNEGSVSEAADCFQTAFELMESAPVSEIL